MYPWLDIYFVHYPFFLYNIFIVYKYNVTYSMNKIDTIFILFIILLKNITAHGYLFIDLFYTINIQFY